MFLKSFTDLELCIKQYNVSLDKVSSALPLSGNQKQSQKHEPALPAANLQHGAVE
jgi:hypothetical protein